MIDILSIQPFRRLFYFTVSKGPAIPSLGLRETVVAPQTLALSEKGVSKLHCRVHRIDTEPILALQKRSANSWDEAFSSRTRTRPSQFDVVKYRWRSLQQESPAFRDIELQPRPKSDGGKLANPQPLLCRLKGCASEPSVSWLPTSLCPSIRCHSTSRVSIDSLDDVGH